ncbi:MAG: 3-oxoacyl-ACP synthase III [Elusimicrobia bacterium]|nr:3-oxoacyl-ACP synthase III [Elusimicrobiota bacterium]
MRYSKVRLDAIGYELAPNVVTSAELESRLGPVYAKLGLQVGQLEQFTGIRERRWWDPGFRLSEGAARAARRALEGSRVRPQDLGLLVYGGVCRESYEPATACAVAEALGVGGGAAIHDVSNACLGALNGVIDAANRIELGQIRAALVVSCESAREINEATIDRMLGDGGIDGFKDSLATLTGGSGAVALLLTDGSFGGPDRRLLGGVHQAAPEHHRICRWGLEPEPVLAGRAGGLRGVREVMRTDAVAVLKYGVALGKRSWDALLAELGWTGERVDRCICHQVGSGHQREILRAFGLPPEKDFTTYETLGNMGTVSLPLTAAVASEREFLRPGDRVAFLGIGSGLNTIMLGWQW